MIYKRLLTTSLLALILLIGSGCSRSKSLGRGPMPMLPETPDPVLTQEEVMAITEFSMKNPHLVKKLQGTTNRRQRVIQKYNEMVRKHNNSILKEFGLDDHELVRKQQ